MCKLVLIFLFVSFFFSRREGHMILVCECFFFVCFSVFFFFFFFFFFLIVLCIFICILLSSAPHTL